MAEIRKEAREERPTVVPDDAVGRTQKRSRNALGAASEEETAVRRRLASSAEGADVHFDGNH
jgi:hypothetical protein